MKKIIFGIIMVASMFFIGMPKSNAILLNEIKSLECTYGHVFLIEKKNNKEIAKIPEEYLCKGTDDEYNFISFIISGDKEKDGEHAFKIKAYDYDSKCFEINENYAGKNNENKWIGNIFCDNTSTTFKILYKGNLYKSIEIEFDEYISVSTKMFTYERFVNPKNISNVEDYIFALKGHEINRPDNDYPNNIETNDIYVELGSNKSINDLTKIIKYSDENCGDLTGTALIYRTEFDINKIGDYKTSILFQDYYANSCIKDVIIHVVDFKAPTITGVNKYNVGIKKYVTIEEILNNLEIKDNSNLESTLDIIDNYTPNKNKVGEYEIIIKAIDQALNFTTFTVTINVSDDVSPTIKGEDKNAYMSKKYANEDFFDFEITDNVTESSKIFKRYETNFDPTKRGEYYVRCSAKDEMGNESIYEVKIFYYDDVAPIFEANNRVFKKYLSRDEIRELFK